MAEATDTTPLLLKALDPAWRDDCDYDEGALKYYDGKIYKALQASGPHRGGVKTPGSEMAFWAELAEIDDTRLVHTSGTETINDPKTFTRVIRLASTGSSGITNSNSLLIRGIPPASPQYMQYVQMGDGLFDSSQQESRMTMVELGVNPTNTVAGVYAYKNEIGTKDRSYVSAVYPNDGSPYGSATNTPDDAPSNAIVTVDYLAKDVANIVHKTGDETIEDTKIFCDLQTTKDFVINFSNANTQATGKRDTPNIICKMSYIAGDPPVADATFGGYAVYDKNNKQLGGSSVIVYSNRIKTTLSAGHNVTGGPPSGEIVNLEVNYPNEGAPYALAPSTRETPQDNEIVTVDYLKKYVAEALDALQTKTG